MTMSQRITHIVKPKTARVKYGRPWREEEEKSGCKRRIEGLRRERERERERETERRITHQQPKTMCIVTQEQCEDIHQCPRGVEINVKCQEEKQGEDLTDSSRKLFRDAVLEIDQRKPDTKSENNTNKNLQVIVCKNSREDWQGEEGGASVGKEEKKFNRIGQEKDTEE